MGRGADWCGGKSPTRIATFWIRLRNSSESESKASSATLTKSYSPLAQAVYLHRVASIVLLFVTFITRTVSFLFLFLFVLLLVWLLP